MRVLFVIILLAFLSFIFYGYLPANAEEVNNTVKLASSNTQAKAEVAKALRQTPNPTRFDLARIDTRVEEIIVTETARVVTGNKYLTTPTEQKILAERQEAEQQAIRKKENDDNIEKIKSKSFVEMKFVDYTVLLRNYLPNIMAIFMATLVVVNLIARMSRI